MEINQAEIEFSKAIQLIELKRYDHAEKFLRNVISLDVNHAGAYSHLALIKYNQQKYDEALELVLESLKIDADSYYSHYLLSKICYSTGKTKKAEESLAIALQIYPENVAALLFKSSIFFNKGDFKPALKVVNEALAIEPENSELLVFKSQCVRALGNKQEAHSLAEDALKNNLESAETWLQKGNLKIEWKDYDAAKSCFENALRLEPENETAKEALLKSLKLKNWFFRVFEPNVAIKLLIPKMTFLLYIIPHTWVGLLFRTFLLQLSDYFSRWGDLFFNLKIYSAHLLIKQRKLSAKIFSVLHLAIILLTITGIVFSVRSNYFISYALLIFCLASISYFNDADDHFSKIIIGIFSVIITGCILGFIFSVHKGPVLTILLLSHFVFNLLYYIRVKVFDLNKRYVEKD